MREKGYYWVKYLPDSEWEPAFFDTKTDTWWNIGFEHNEEDKRFWKIGERIAQPTA